MTAGFVATDYDWLLTRFATDEACRSKALADEVASRMVDCDPIRVVDLGAGAGANSLHVAPLLAGCDQRWTLVDRDAELIQRIRACHETFARNRTDLTVQGQTLQLGKKRLAIDACVGDFLHGDCGIYQETPDLVVANAVFDLMSAEQLETFVVLAKNRWRTCRPLLYFTIHPDGEMAFDPAGPDDSRVIALFFAHMQREQGFGRAMGGAAAGQLERVLAAHDFRITAADSTLRIDPRDRTALHANLDFFPSAVGEMIDTGCGEGLTRQELTRWISHKRSLIDGGKLALSIGHRDHIATWP